MKPIETLAENNKKKSTGKKYGQKYDFHVKDMKTFRFILTINI